MFDNSKPQTVPYQMRELSVVITVLNEQDAEINIRTYFEGTNRKTYQARRIFNGKKEDLEHR